MTDVVKNTALKDLLIGMLLFSHLTITDGKVMKVAVHKGFASGECKGEEKLTYYPSGECYKTSGVYLKYTCASDGVQYNYHGWESSAKDCKNMPMSSKKYTLGKCDDTTMIEKCEVMDCDTNMACKATTEKLQPTKSPLASKSGREVVVWKNFEAPQDECTNKAATKTTHYPTNECLEINTGVHAKYTCHASHTKVAIYGKDAKCADPPDTSYDIQFGQCSKVGMPENCGVVNCDGDSNCKVGVKVTTSISPAVSKSTNMVMAGAVHLITAAARAL